MGSTVSQPRVLGKPIYVLFVFITVYSDRTNSWSNSNRQKMLWLSPSIAIRIVCQPDMNLKLFSMQLFYYQNLKWADMRLWHLSPSVNSIFKHACAAIHWGYKSDFWSDPSSTWIHYVCEQRRLWRDSASRSEGSGETARLAWAIRLCNKYHNLMSWLKY